MPHVLEADALDVRHLAEGVEDDAVDHVGEYGERDRGQYKRSHVEPHVQAGGSHGGQIHGIVPLGRGE